MLRGGWRPRRNGPRPAAGPGRCGRHGLGEARRLSARLPWRHGASLDPGAVGRSRPGRALRPSAATSGDRGPAAARRGRFAGHRLGHQRATGAVQLRGDGAAMGPAEPPRLRGPKRAVLLRVDEHRGDIFFGGARTGHRSAVPHVRRPHRCTVGHPHRGLRRSELAGPLAPRTSAAAVHVPHGRLVVPAATAGGRPARARGRQPATGSSPP